MKAWMHAALTVCTCVLILSVAVGVYRVMDAADRTVEQTRLMVTSLRATTMQVHRLAQDAVENQRVLVDGITRLSAATAGSIDRTATEAAAAFARTACRIERLADALECAVDTVTAEVSGGISDARVEVALVSRDAREAIAGVRPLLDTTRDSLDRVTGEVCETTAGVRPVLSNTASLVATVGGIAAQCEKIAASGANVAAHYERMILHPSAGQRIKGWMQLLMSGFTIVANSKILF